MGGCLSAVWTCVTCLFGSNKPNTHATALTASIRREAVADHHITSTHWSKAPENSQADVSDNTVNGPYYTGEDPGPSPLLTRSGSRHFERSPSRKRSRKRSREPKNDSRKARGRPDIARLYKAPAKHAAHPPKEVDLRQLTDEQLQDHLLKEAEQKRYSKQMEEKRKADEFRNGMYGGLMRAMSSKPCHPNSGNQPVWAMSPTALSAEVNERNDCLHGRSRSARPRIHWADPPEEI